MAGDRDTDLPGADIPSRRLDAEHAAAFDPETGDLAVLDDVDTARVGAARIAPGDRVVAGVATAGLQQRADDRIARVLRAVEQRNAALHLLAAQPFGVDAVESHRVAAAEEGVALRIRMREVVDAALAE